MRNVLVSQWNSFYVTNTSMPIVLFLSANVRPVNRNPLKQSLPVMQRFSKLDEFRCELVPVGIGIGVGSHFLAVVFCFTHSALQPTDYSSKIVFLFHFVDASKKRLQVLLALEDSRPQGFYFNL
mmetsp:Transcript_23442/g.47058  ORF Transcript_23442/g.47058 Transcript_23442/m.47058 type:complete len:124 (-) Transcript_23442:302-673(-)